MLPPGAIFQLKIHKNVFAALLKTPSWFSGDLFAGGDGRGGEWREGRRKQREGREMEG